MQAAFFQWKPMQANWRAKIKAKCILWVSEKCLTTSQDWPNTAFMSGSKRVNFLKMLKALSGLFETPFCCKI